MSEVELRIDRLDGFFARADALARRLDAGGDVRDRINLSFESMDGLLGVLTPNRWRLMRALKASGPSSIRALAQALGRDYRGVHADVAALREAGLVMRDVSGAVSVPWSRIAVEMALDAAA
jgi:predicted transcriptional regulator